MPERRTSPPLIGDLSAVVQDYLKVICTAREWDDTPVTTSALAAKIGVSASTASEMIRRMATLGLVDHQPYGAVALTRHGRLLALRMMRRHRLIETYLVAELGYRWDQVHDEAEILEHAISDLMLARIDAKLNHPSRDPHGDPIPGEDGTVVRPNARRLSLLEPGESGVIARISDADPTLLRYFTVRSIALDQQVTVLERLPFGAGTALRLDGPGPDGSSGSRVEIGDEALRAIWVTPATPDPAQLASSAPAITS